MVDPVVNKGKVTVSTGYNSTATSIVLATGQGAELPDPVVDGAYNLPWWDSTNYNDPADDPNFEIVRVTGPSGTGDTKTIVRAQEGTAASNKNNADATYKMILATTAKTITDLIPEHAATVIVGKSGNVDYLTTDYGSDDACIQAAINYVDGLGGGSVLVREGAYTISSQILGCDNLNLVGVGYTTVFTPANGLNDHTIKFSSKSNFSIKNIRIDGNLANQTSGDGIRLMDVENVILSDLYVDDCKEYGINIVSTAETEYIDNVNIVVKDSFLTGNGKASIVAFCGDKILFKNLFTTTNQSNPAKIMSMDYVSNGIVDGCTILRTQISQVAFIGIGVKNIAIINNHVPETTYTGDGITIDETANGKALTSTNVVISSNIVHSKNTWGIIVGDPTDTITDTHIIISNNSVYQTRVSANGPGIKTFKSQYITVSNNQIYESYVGIELALGCQFFAISNNTINNTSYSGISISASQDGNISGNEIYNYGIDAGEKRGISFSAGTYVLVSNNHINDGQVGIFSENSSDYLNVSNNDVVGNSTLGVKLTTGTNNIKRDNVGYNPLGNITSPAVPATTVNYTNAYGYPCQVQVYGGTVTEIDIDDIATGLTSGVFIIPSGGTINITYSAAPSWRWWGL